MNRHQRRKQKKEQKVVQPFPKELEEIIKTHLNKNYDHAEEEYKKLLKKIPNDYETIRHLGILYFDTHRLEQAYNCFQSAINVNPTRCEAFNNLGFVHIKNGNLDLAEKCLKKSYEINSKYIPTLNNLAGLYIDKQIPKTAIKYAKAVLLLDPENPISNNQYAKALILSGGLEEAIKIFEKLCAKHPLTRDFLMNLATAYREIGDIEKADKIISEEFEKDYKYLDFFLLYATNKSNKLKSEHIKYYEKMVEKDSDSDRLAIKNQIKLCETFYLYYKNVKNLEKSAKYLLKMNKIQFGLKKFDLQLEESFFNTIRSVSAKKIEFRINKVGKIVPIFICGMPRSGTTLCEQILSSHSKVTGAGELNFLANLTGIGTSVQVEDDVIVKFEKNVSDKDFLINIRKEYVSKLLDLRENKNQFICDKMPHNFVFIGLIRTVLPEAKIIYCKRDPMDNCFSLYAHKFIEMSHQYSYDQKTVAQYYKSHVELMNFWIKKYQNDIFVLDNETLIKNQEKISRDILSFCGLDWEEQCLEFYKTKRQVRTASIDQVRKPLNNKSIGAWKYYKPSLSELIKHLK
mgnify:CR=1 FL=1